MNNKHWLDEPIDLDDVYGKESDYPYWLMHPWLWLKSIFTKDQPN